MAGERGGKMLVAGKARCESPIDGAVSASREDRDCLWRLVRGRLDGRGSLEYCNIKDEVIFFV